MSDTERSEESSAETESGPLMRCGLRRRLDAPERRAYWAHVDRNVAEAASWPAWKRGLGEFTESGR